MKTFRHDWENFFNQLLKDSIQSPTKAKHYQRLGIDYQDWPDCEAKNLMAQLKALEASKTEAIARTKVGALSLNLGGSALPEAGVELKAEYDELIRDIKSRQLAEKILANTDRTEDLVREYLIRGKSGVKSFGLDEAVSFTLKKLERDIQEGKALVELEHWPILSKMVGGFNPGRLSMITAASGAGKTNWALNLMLDAGLTEATLFFNMEMMLDDITGRVIRRNLKINPDAYFRGELNDGLGLLGQRLDRMKPTFITDGSAQNLKEIIAEIHQKNDAHNLGFVFIDYDQKIRNSFRGEEWARMLMAFEELEQCAKDTETHIFILSQGNDEGDPKASKRSKQPVSSVLWFFEQDGDFYVKAVKNRHGITNATLKLSYNPAHSSVKEERLGGPKKSLL